MTESRDRNQVIDNPAASDNSKIGVPIPQEVLSVLRRLSCRGQRAIPIVGKPISAAGKYPLPMSTDPDPRWRVLDTLDWHSPWYQSKHTYEEVFRWFEDCGLEDLRVGLQPVAVTGRKPLAVAPMADAPMREIQPCAE